LAGLRLPLAVAVVSAMTGGRKNPVTSQSALAIFVKRIDSKDLKVTLV
jgi:hypothetical protein